MHITVLKVLLWFTAALPLPLSHGLGYVVGRGLALFPGRLHRDITTNIALCLPHLSKHEQRRLIGKTLVETAKTLMEAGALWLRPGQMSLKLIREVDGNKHVIDARKKGKGVILVTPHLGAWEAAGLYGAANFSMTCLYRPLRIPQLEKMVRHARNRLGANYVPATSSGIRALYSALRKGGAVAMLPDQEPQAGTGIFSPFFDVPAYSMVFLSRLAAKTGAPLVFAWCERLSFGRGYILHFRPAPQDVYAIDTETSVAAINRAVENCIMECPEQYQWGYRRFKTRPTGEPALYT